MLSFTLKERSLFKQGIGIELQADFETGDLLITVKLMEENYRVGYYTGLKVQINGLVPVILAIKPADPLLLGLK